MKNTSILSEIHDEDEKSLSDYTLLELMDYIDELYTFYKVIVDKSLRKEKRKLYTEATELYNKRINFEAYNTSLY